MIKLFKKVPHVVRLMIFRKYNQTEADIVNISTSDIVKIRASNSRKREL